MLVVAAIVALTGLVVLQWRPSPGRQHDQSAATTAEPAGQASNAVVVRVVDGDTIEVDMDGNRSLVRLIGIDTPEKTGGILPPECFGDEATSITSTLLTPGAPVFLERDVELHDRYDRLLAYVHRSQDGLFVNHYLVDAGAAVAKTYEPNSFHAEILHDAERQARAANRGLWQVCGGPDQPLQS